MVQMFGKNERQDGWIWNRHFAHADDRNSLNKRLLTPSFSLIPSFPHNNPHNNPIKAIDTTAENKVFEKMLA